jgi:hypothetical protein
MKKIFILSLLCICFSFSSVCKAENTQNAESSNKKNTIASSNKIDINNKKNEQEARNYVDAYYFHGDFRCRSCRLIETMTKDVIQNNFKNDLASKILRFKVINVEEPENKHFIKDYGLYSKSVVLSLIQDNKEIKYKNLDKIWSYLGNEKTFKEYVESEVKIFLKDRK